MTEKRRTGAAQESVQPEPQEAPLIENRKLFVLVAIVLGIILAVFAMKFFLKDQGASYPHYTYNGYEFYQYAGLWNTEWQQANKLYQVHIRYGPRESEDVQVFEGPDVTFNPQGKLYLTHDPAEGGLGYVALASAELSLTLSQVFNITPIAACTQNTTSACASRPIINCESNPGQGAVIYLKEIPDPAETAIILNGNCMQVQGSREELVRAADKVIWIWYGIIK
ncbi:hypothetical protein HYV81_04885 [Candidatus Woesearchaeota archaeon]|nr:hypothetical protein [Candidatus Woesearchaeota archaeon]